MIAQRKISKRQLAVYALERSGLGFLLRCIGAWQGVLGLCYHRVGYPPSSPFGRELELLSATPEGFDAQVRFLKKHFDVIGPGDLTAASRKGRGRYVLITFDDGYRDNYEQAFPILKSHGVGATFFLATGFLDNPRPAWWDDLAWMVRTSKRSLLPASSWFPSPVVFDEPGRGRAVSQLVKVYTALPGEKTEAYLDYLAEATGSGRCPVECAAGLWMTWDMARAMQVGGMWFGGHTVNHPVLARLPREQQLREITDCRRRLEAELGQPMTCFSYPNGDARAFDDETRSVLRAEGVQFTFSYYGGYRRFDDWDPYDVRRTTVESYFSPEAFRAVTTLPQVFAHH